MRNRDPLGELLEDSRRRTLQIVGVARDTESGFGAAATSIVYTPRADGSGGAMRNLRGHLDGVVQVSRLDQIKPASCSFISANWPSVHR